MIKFLRVDSTFRCRSYHYNQVVDSYYDDIESWLYIVYYVFSQNSLPWKLPFVCNGQGNELTEKEMFMMKMGFFQNKCKGFDSVVKSGFVTNSVL